MPLDPLTEEVDLAGVLEATFTPMINQEAFCLFYEVETVLRELIVSEMELAFGAKWWKSRLKGEDQKRPFEESIEYERKQKWTQSISFHPVYYLLFTEIKEIIFRKDNWREVFQRILGSQDHIFGSMTDAEPIRNKIAHNRKLSAADLVHLQSLHERLTISIGPDNFRRLGSRMTSAEGIPEIFGKLQREIVDAIKLVETLKQVNLSIWSSVEPSWWYESEYLGQDVTPITQLMNHLVEYSLLPRGRGALLELQSWRERTPLIEQYGLAKPVLDTLTNVPGA